MDIFTTALGMGITVTHIDVDKNTVTVIEPETPAK